MSARPAPKPEPRREHRAPRRDGPPDVTRTDVKRVCEEIWRIAKHELHWDLETLGEEAGHAWQSFHNWKKGSELPKVGFLQNFAAPVGTRIRVILEAIADSQGRTVVISPGVGEDTVPKTPGDDELAKALGLAALTDPGVRRAATLAAREAAMKAVADHFKGGATAHPSRPTAENSPSRSRRKAAGNPRT